MVRVDLETEQTPTVRGRADLVPFQALMALLDAATPLEQLELVELATIAAGMTPDDRRWLIETAARARPK